MNTIHRELPSHREAKAIRQQAEFISLEEAQLAYESEWVPSAIRELERHERPFRPHPEQDQWVHDRSSELAFA